MTRRMTSVLLILMVALFAAAPALAQAPSFNPEIYADDAAWGTKGLAELPVPNETMAAKSFDALYVIINGAAGQLPVGEAAPGNPAFNGGRWATKTVWWTQAGIDAHDPLPILMSQDDIDLHYGLGHLAIVDGSPGGPGAPPDYFECPLLPVK